MHVLISSQRQIVIPLLYSRPKVPDLITVTLINGSFMENSSFQDCVVLCSSSRGGLAGNKTEVGQGRTVPFVYWTPGAG